MGTTNLSNRDALRAFHEARRQHALAKDRGVDPAPTRKILRAAEAVLIERFGKGPHLVRYRKEFPEGSI